MKKLLSLILAILMVVTSIPFAFAAESDGVKTVLDVSKGEVLITDSSVTVNSENVEVDPDGYIITGRSEGLEYSVKVVNYSNSTKTFDLVFKDVTIIAKKWSPAFSLGNSINSTTVLNISCEGNNTFISENHAFFMRSPVGGLIANVTIPDDATLQYTRLDGEENSLFEFASDVVFINGKQVGRDGHVHEKNSDAEQTCKGYECNICDLYFGEKLPDAHKSNGVQTCLGYYCTICNKYFGEPGDHIKKEQNCQGILCKTCNKYYGEKDETVHNWLLGYCTYCDAKMPEGTECSHDYYYGICAICAVVDETSDVDIESDEFSELREAIPVARLNNYFSTYDDDAIMEIYTSEKATELLLEIYNSLEDAQGTVGENKARVEKYIEDSMKFTDNFKRCLEGEHNVVEYKLNDDVTCTVDGTKTGDCGFCGKSHTTAAQAIGHAFDEYASNGDATCTADGTKTASCANGCGTTDTVIEVDSMLDHIFLDYTSNGDATCEADGTKTAVCNFGCGAKDTVTDKSTMLEHVDEDDDDLCDGCGGSMLCEDCGRPVHEGQINEYICMLITLIKLIVSFFNAVK